MFVDESLDPIVFPSSWKKERYITDTGVQTKELETEDQACQSRKMKNREVQTEDEIEDLAVVDDDRDQYHRFVGYAGPILLKQIQRNIRSHAFDGYTVAWEEETDTVTNIHTLSYKQEESNEQMQVTGLAWNSTGAVIAAAYGRLDHEDWCTHKSALCTWNLDRRSIDPSKPDQLIDLPCCLMAIACHPKNPSWICGGTFNGEVMVWDLSREDEMLVASSGIGDDSHREPVSKVTWVEDHESKGKVKYHVVSVSSDGKILVWKINRHKKTIKLQDGFILLTEALPRSMRMRAKRGDQEMGVTCISHSPTDNTMFLIGSESGGIFRCSSATRGTHANSSVISSVALQSPVSFAFSPHHGPVYGIDSSPFHRNLFITCSVDTSTRIYSMLQTEPVITLEPGAGYIYSARWSPVRPLVFAMAAENGQVLIYDLKFNRAVPKFKLDGSPSKHAVFTLQFNHKQNLLACGDADGNICIWKLSDELTNQAPQEMDLLEEIASSVLE